MNNLDPAVAEKPDELIVYGGAGKAARNWNAFDAIVRELQQLGNDETLLVQSGKPVGVFRTHDYAPRVLIANSNLVGAWANWDHFHELERRGLMMYGQMTPAVGSTSARRELFRAPSRHLLRSRQTLRRQFKWKTRCVRRYGRNGWRATSAATLNGAVFLWYRRRSGAYSTESAYRILRSPGPDFGRSNRYLRGRARAEPRDLSWTRW
jgi:hypothetical protein